MSTRRGDSNEWLEEKRTELESVLEQTRKRVLYSVGWVVLLAAVLFINLKARIPFLTIISVIILGMEVFRLTRFRKTVERIEAELSSMPPRPDVIDVDARDVKGKSKPG